MKVIILTIALLLAQLAFAKVNFSEIQIAEDIQLKIMERRSVRSDPHSPYDQAIASIKRIYPNSTILAKRRYGHIGEIQYSIICYKESKDSNEVVINGTSVHNETALVFETIIKEEQFGDYLLIILERVEKMSSKNKRNSDSSANVPPQVR